MPTTTTTANTSKNLRFLRTNKYKLLKFTLQRYLALIITSIITISSMHSLEILSCLIRENNLHIMFLKLSSCLVSLLFVLMMCCRKAGDLEYDSKNKKHCPYNTHEMPANIDMVSQMKPPKTSYYYNLFVNENIFDKMGDDDDIHFLNETAQHLDGNNDSIQSSLLLGPLTTATASGEKNKTDTFLSVNQDTVNAFKLTSNQKYVLRFLHQSRLKSNFYMIIISVLLIHFWIIGTYLFSYIFSSSSYSHLINSYRMSESYESIRNFIEICLASVGGVGAALFFKNIVLGLFEISAYNKVRRVRRFIDFNMSLTKMSSKQQTSSKASASSFTNIKEQGKTLLLLYYSGTILFYSQINLN